VHPKYLFGVIAVGIYVAVIALVFFYFGYHRDHKTTRFVAKNSEAITVTLQGAKASSPPLRKSQPKPRKTPHTRPKPVTTNKPASRPKRSVKTKPAKKNPPKRVKPKSLFSNVKTAKPTPKRTAKPPRKTVKSSVTGKHARRSTPKEAPRDKGIEDRYLAGVQDRLYGWPAQPSFAGAVYTIGLTILPNGRFRYVVLQPSANPEFNRTIETYLKELQAEGFGPTPAGKKYEFKVEIVAK